MSAEQNQAQQVILDDVTEVSHTRADAAACSASSTSNGSLRTATASARNRSTARRRAAVSNQAGGFVGTPSAGQCRAAASNASDSVLGEVQAAVLADEQREQPPPVLPVCRVERRVPVHPTRLNHPTKSSAPLRYFGGTPIKRLPGEAATRTRATPGGSLRS